MPEVERELKALQTSLLLLPESRSMYAGSNTLVMTDSYRASFHSTGRRVTRGRNIFIHLSAKGSLEISRGTPGSIANVTAEIRNRPDVLEVHLSTKDCLICSTI